MLLSESIRMLRQKSLMTQESFAKEINVATTTVNRWETGKARPNMTAMKAIKAFCKSCDYPYEDIENSWLHYTTGGTNNE